MMTTEELNKIFKEVDLEMSKPENLQKFINEFRQEAENSGKSLNDILPPLMLAMHHYSMKFMFRVLSKVLTKD